MHPSFYQTVYQTWKPEGNLDTNKQALSETLNDWNKNSFANIFHRKNHLISRINGVQRKLCTTSRADLHRLDMKLLAELEEVLYQEELNCLKRSREDWIISGDRNTRYYHVATTMKNKGMIMKAIKKEDSILIAERAVNQKPYSRLLSSTFHR